MSLTQELNSNPLPFVSKNRALPRLLTSAQMFGEGDEKGESGLEATSLVPLHPLPSPAAFASLESCRQGAGKHPIHPDPGRSCSRGVGVLLAATRCLINFGVKTGSAQHLCYFNMTLMHGREQSPPPP